MGGLKLEAASSGKWGANLRATVDTDNISEDVAKGMGLTKKEDLFNLTVRDAAPNGKTEKFLNLTVVDSARRIDKVLAANSALVRCQKNKKDEPDLPKTVTVDSDDVTKKEKAYVDAKKTLSEKRNEDPKASDAAAKKAKENLDDEIKKANDGVSAASVLKATDFLPKDGESEKKGLHALEQADLFNILCIPPYTSTNDVDVNLVSAAAAYCEKRRAMLIVDSPSTWKDKDTARKEFTDPDDKVGTRSRNAAFFFPRLRQSNPLRDNQPEDFAACGAVAGIMARTDTQRGVWKAPAGLDATLVGVPSLSVSLTDPENGELNPLGINCLRAFPASGRVVWGARTLRGNDQLADEYKYIPVRRTALYIEESLYRGLKWVVFEPNDEPLWSQIRLNVGAFMHNLFRQGAFQGTTPKDAYFVKCDKEANPQNDIDLGIVNVIVGFAPLKPAEFVIIKLQQIAGQIEV